MPRRSTTIMHQFSVSVGSHLVTFGYLASATTSQCSFVYSTARLDRSPHTTVRLHNPLVLRFRLWLCASQSLPLPFPTRRHDGVELLIPLRLSARWCLFPCFPSRFSSHPGSAMLDCWMYAQNPYGPLVYLLTLIPIETLHVQLISLVFRSQTTSRACASVITSRLYLPYATL